MASMRRLTPILVLAAFIFSCGGQWYALQGLAWINMIRDYSQMVPFTEAVSMTLSGQYPCAICKVIAEKQQSENNKICSIEKYEKKSFPPVSIAIAHPLAAPFQYADYLSSLQSRSEPPPTPPPRQA
jgi:hypothetical protein